MTSSRRRENVERNYNEEEMVAGFICSISSCGLSFKRSTLLDQHLREHLEKELAKLNKSSAHKRLKPRKVCPLVKLRKETFVRLKERRERRKLMHTNFEPSGKEGAITICQVCLQDVKGSLDDHKQHIKACIRVNNLQEGEERDDNEALEDTEEEFEEYTWSGQTRIRASSLVALGAAGGDFTKILKTDENEELDVTGETENFGPSQYSEQNLKTLPHSSQESSSQEISSVPGPSNVCSTKPQVSFHITKSNIDKNAQNVSEVEKIQNELLNLHRAHACRVCLDEISRHVVSTVCWHVHCESCWVQVMASKKICPQCKAIVTPADLRRIYM